MKKLLVSLFSVFSLLIIVSTPVFAANFATGDNVLISENSPEDLYLLAGNASVDADVFGDLHIAGGSVTVNGNVSEDLVVAGGRVTVIGNVGGDLRIMGGQVAVYGNVSEDLLALGGQVDIGKKSTVYGSVITGSGYLTIDGNVNQDIRGAVGMLILNGNVGRDIVLTVQDNILISKNASIAGDVNYSALIEADIPPNVIKGTYNFNKFDAKEEVVKFTSAFLIVKVLSYLSALVLLLILVFISPKSLVRSAEITKGNVFKSFSIGLLTMIIAFIGSMILMITIIGIPLAIIVFSGLLVAFYLTKIFVAAWIANYFFKLNSKKYKSIDEKAKLFFSIALVLFVYFIAVMIPIFGWILNIILFFIGIGSIVLLKIEYFSFLRSKKVI